MDAVERAAIDACITGDLSQFDVLYTRHVSAIYSYLYRRTLHRQTAEDLTSTTFLKALDKIRTYRCERSPFIAWLYAIARNTLTDYFRTNHPTADIADILGLSGEDDASAGAKHAVDLQRVRTALHGLTALQRDVVLLRLWDGLSHAEIARIVGKSEANCKVIFSRTLSSLRSDLGAAALLLFLLPTLR